MSALSKKYKNKIWETGAGHYRLVLVESRHICIFMSNDNPNIFFERINFFYRQITRIFFFYEDFLSITLTNHRTAGEREGIIFYFTIPLPPAHRDFLYILPNYRPVFWSTESFQNCVKDTSTSCLLRYWVFVFKKKSLRPRANFSRAIFVRFNTNLMIVLKIEFEQVMHLKVGWFLF